MSPPLLHHWPTIPPRLTWSWAASGVSGDSEIQCFCLASQHASKQSAPGEGIASGLQNNGLQILLRAAYDRMTHLIPLSLLPLFGIFCCLPVGETF